jgi:hypothetical protein
MTLTAEKSIATPISGDTEVAGALRSRRLKLLRRSDFPTPRKNQELLPLNAADRVSKTIDEDRRQREDHHPLLRQIHLSQRRICLNKRSHPFPRGGFRPVRRNTFTRKVWTVMRAYRPPP